jgi:hypothetical protein
VKTALSYLVVPASWILGAAACWFTCRLRKVEVTALPCFIIAGLILVLGGVPLPLPDFLQTVVVYALTVYVTMKYLGVALVPDGLLIPLVTKLFGAGVAFVLELILKR